MSQRSQISQIHIQRNLLSRLWILVEKVGHSELHGILVLPIDRRGEQRREWCDRYLGDSVVLAERIEEGVLELGWVV